MNSGGHQPDLFPFRFNLGSMLGSGLASGRVSRHESVTSSGQHQLKSGPIVSVQVRVLSYLIQSSQFFSAIVTFISFRFGSVLSLSFGSGCFASGPETAANLVNCRLKPVNCLDIESNPRLGIQ
ncbi:hypothetical protein Hanom_Chr15g01377301 [Helianthus anomalus]